MEIWKKGLFGKHKMVMFNIPLKEVSNTLKALPKGKFFYINDDGEKVFYKSPELQLEEWIG